MMVVQRLIFFSLALLWFAGLLAFIENAPYFYIFLSLFCMMIFRALKIKKFPIKKAILTNLAAVILALALAEAYLAGWEGLGLSPKLVQNNILLEKGVLATESDIFAMDDVRGYALAKNSKIRSVETLGNKTIYDVVYTASQHGLRVAPHNLKDSSVIPPKHYQNVVFFGCSCTFGEGVQDHETWPYLLEEKSGGRYQSYNFAMEGYGPHQMLRILETGLLDDIMMDKQPSIAIYLALPQHIIRSSCKYPYFTWDVNGPRYVLNSRHEVEYMGKFNETLFLKLKFMIFQQLAKSYLISESFWIKELLGWNIYQVDKETFIEIILKAREIFCQKFNGKFYVILWANNIWSDESDEYKYVAAELQKRQVHVIDTKDIFANRNHNNKEIYQINYDGHPNPLAYQKVAEYMLNYLNVNLGE